MRLMMLGQMPGWRRRGAGGAFDEPGSVRVAREALAKVAAMGEKPG